MSLNRVLFKIIKCTLQATELHSLQSHCVNSTEPNYDDYDDEEEVQPKKKKKLEKKPSKVKSEPDDGPSPPKRKKKGQEDEGEVWKW